MKVKTQFKSNLIAKNLEIIVPVPPDFVPPDFKANLGTVRYLPYTNGMIWLIKQFLGRNEDKFRRPLRLKSDRSIVVFPSNTR